MTKKHWSGLAAVLLVVCACMTLTGVAVSYMETGRFSSAAIVNSAFAVVLLVLSLRTICITLRGGE